ncbi:MAG: acyltransferase, partial [bacterium]
MGEVKIGACFFEGGWIDPTPCGDVVIGDYVVLGHGSRIIRHCPIRSFEHNRISIGDFCYIGDGARILLGADIGKGCVVGALAVVSGPVPPYSIVAGNPARVIRKRDAYEMLRTFVLKYGDPDPVTLGMREADWTLLGWQDVKFLLRNPTYDDHEIQFNEELDVMAVVEFYRT